MAVRNFWMEAKIDGRNTEVKGGPKSKEGGMDIYLYQRDCGTIETAVHILCEAQGDKLITDVYINGSFSGRYETQR